MMNTLITETTFFRRKLWVAAGLVFVALGIIGYLTPLMPGLVFFILASFCFAKGSRKFLRVLLSNPHIGPQIMDWKRGKGMLLKTKIMAIVMVVLSMGISALYIVKQEWVKWCIGACAILVVTLIILIKTKKKENKRDQI